MGGGRYRQDNGGGPKRHNRLGGILRHSAVQHHGSHRCRDDLAHIFLLPHDDLRRLTYLRHVLASLSGGRDTASGNPDEENKRNTENTFEHDWPRLPELFTIN